MATSPDLIDSPDPRRPIDRWLSSYSGDHVNATNQAIHMVCVPAIVWSVTAAFWLIPVPAALARPGAWMALEKPGTMVAISTPMVVNRLAWIQWRRVHRPSGR